LEVALHSKEEARSWQDLRINEQGLELLELRRLRHENPQLKYLSAERDLFRFSGRPVSAE